MTAWFPNAPAALRNKLKPNLDDAFAVLGWDEQVLAYIGLPETEPAEALAVALDDGIHFNPLFARQADGTGLRAVCFEEAGHAFLGRLGVPHHGPLAVLMQEAFATWFSFSYLAAEGSLDLAEDLNTDDIPSDPDDSQLPLVHWMAGKQAGAAMAGSVDAREALERWCAHHLTGQWSGAVASVTTGLLGHELSPGAEPEEVGRWFASEYKRLAAMASNPA